MCESRVLGLFMVSLNH